MSKRAERIAAARARTPEETKALRQAERAKPASQVARWVEGPLKGKTLAEIGKT